MLVTDTKTLLIVIDVQHDFVDGALGTPEARQMLPHLISKLQQFNGHLVLTQDTHDENYLHSAEGQQLPIKHCIQGTSGWGLMEDLKVIAQERKAKIFCKSSFGSLELAAFVHAKYASGEIARVELCGLCTDICVISNALLLKAYCPELPLAVDAACCAGVSPALHQAALQVMRSCQVAVYPD